MAKPDWDEMARHFSSLEGRDVTPDLGALAARESGRLSWGVKTALIIAGFLASSFFISTLFLLEIVFSEGAMLVLGVVFLAASVAIVRGSDQPHREPLALSTLMSGISLCSIGLGSLLENTPLVMLLTAALVLVLLPFLRDYLPVLVAVVSVSGLMTAALFESGHVKWMHGIVLCFGLLQSAALYTEAGMVTANVWWADHYAPVRSALTLSFLVMLVLYAFPAAWDVEAHWLWMLSAFFMAAIGYELFHLSGKLALKVPSHRLIFTGLALVAIGPAVFSPALCGALLVVLQSVRVQYRAGLVLGMVAAVYFTGQFYYDLTWTLLTKSVVLMASGFMFLMLFALFQHIFKERHETV